MPDALKNILLRVGVNGLVGHGELKELEKDRMPVGKAEREQEFKLHTISIEPGDFLYLYTDGYADQFGGPKGKKYK